ncbi:DNA cytosine methyltransferase [Microseira sp. BLCC-F43]|uniref:DNA cytosine methyltransferase n=1 Tax=Microseira sp. BLCC-F43 TaxID=3153602 RepID=UPI0035B7DEF4
MKLRCIDYLAGIGAWELAIDLVNINYLVQFNTIKFIEINPFAFHVLRSHYPDIPIHSDIRNYQPVPSEADIYLISFPCTGTSIAGKRNGLEHPESNLWYESLRCIIFGRPKFVVVEQPEGIVNRGLRAVVAGLHLAGYQTEIEIISAAELGAPHRRNRIFIIAYADNLCIKQRKGWCEWSDQIRNHIAIARSLEYPSQTKSQALSLDDGLSRYLAGLSFSEWWKRNLAPRSSGVGMKLNGRREAINLTARSIVPLQAAIALMRVKHLAMLL